MTLLERRHWSPSGRELRPVGCNLCAGESARRLAIENGLEVLRCRRCGLVYVSPQPSPAELERFYAEYYPEESEADWYRVMIAHFRRDAERLERRLGYTGRVLDVGTGFGHFPALLRERGFEAAALEPAPVAAQRLRERGLSVYEGSLPGASLPEAHFDAVTLESVLEHVADPLGVLTEAARALRPGGLVLVRVPNVELLGLFFAAARLQRVGPVRAIVRVLRREMMDEANLFNVIDPPGHLFGFSQGPLRRALERAGFEGVELFGDPMHARGTALNAWIDGAVHAGAALLRRLSGGHLELAPNLLAIARRPPDPPARGRPGAAAGSRERLFGAQGTERPSAEAPELRGA